MRQKVVWFVLGVLVGSLFVVSAYLTNGSARHTVPAFQRINNAVPVYYVGSGISKYFTNTIQANPSLSVRTPHILIVESSAVKNNPQFRKLVRRELLSGIPVIVIGDPGVINGTFRGQFFTELVAGQGPYGRIKNATVYGYVTYPSQGTLVSKEFVSIDTNQGQSKKPTAGLSLLLGC